jgi:hypothetical protein
MTDDFQPPKNDINEFDFDFLESIPPEPKQVEECSFAHEVRRLKREVKESKTQLKKVREENNRLHAKCSKQREIIERYRKGATPSTIESTGGIVSRPPQRIQQMPQMVIGQAPAPQMVYSGYPMTGPVIVNDLNGRRPYGY